MMWWRVRCAIGLHPLEWRSCVRPFGDGRRASISSEYRCRRFDCPSSERWKIADVELVPNERVMTLEDELDELVGKIASP